MNTTPSNTPTEIRANELRGTYMLLDEASVTGTANIIMAAILPKAPRPYTMRLVSPIYSSFAECCAEWEQNRGHRLQSADNSRRGIASRHNPPHTPDMIEIGSFIGMAAMTGSHITLKNVSYNDLGIMPDSFKRIGIELQVKGDDIVIPST